MTDKLDSSKEPSKGAMRAAKLVAEEYERARNFGRSASPSHDRLADLIDRETKAGEMAILLGRVADSLDVPPGLRDDARRLLSDLGGKL